MSHGDKHWKEDKPETVEQALELLRFGAVMNHITDPNPVDQQRTERRMLACADFFEKAQSARVPQGWKLVPVEPTERMLECFGHEHCVSGTSYECYENMLAAAPSHEGTNNAEAQQEYREMADRAQHGLDPIPSSTGTISVPKGLVDALHTQKQCDPDGVECQVSRQAVDEACAILEQIERGGRWCSVSFPHQPHDTCDGSAAVSATERSEPLAKALIEIALMKDDDPDPWVGSARFVDCKKIAMKALNWSVVPSDGTAKP